MRMNNVPAWNHHVEWRDAVRSARVMRSTFSRVKSGNMQIRVSDYRIYNEVGGCKTE